MHEARRHGSPALLILAAFLTALFAVCLTAGTASAATITVNTSNDENGAGAGCSLREAIQAANTNADFGGCTGVGYGNDTITFAAGTNGVPITLTLGAELFIGTNIQIQGNGAGVTIVDGNNATRLFQTAVGTVGFSGLTIRNANPGATTGGGILVNSGTVTVTSSTISGNTAGIGSGGGMFVGGGTVTITDSTFSGNSAQDGGGMSVTGGSVTVTGSTFSGNTATNRGGGIQMGGSTRVTNSTFNGNTAPNGGAVSVNAGTSFAIHSTLKDNIATNNGGGFHAIGGELTLRANIFATSTNGNCVNAGGTVGSDGSNLLDDATCPAEFNQTGDQHNVTGLNLGPLANNGGPTQTFALQAGSAAIDAVQDGCTEEGINGGATVTVDQRGVPRPKDGNADGSPICDVGAYEAPAAGKLQFSASNFPVNENAGPAVITVTRVNGSEGIVGATVTTSDGTATQPADYSPVATTVSFGDGVTTGQTVNVPIVNDTIDEPDETINLTLSNPTGNAVLGSPSTATVTIADDDPAPTISINDVTVIEGDSGSAAAVFAVTLSNPSSQNVTVSALTADGTAAAGSDYTATGPTTLTFTPGVTSQPFTVPVLGDTVNEPNETFFVNLSGASNATILDGQGLGTITDDDPLTVSIDDQTAIEGNSGSVNAVFHVTLNRASSQAVTVQAQTANGSATAGTDYTAVGPTVLTFAPGTTSQTFAVPVLGDAVDEPNETFLVNLSNLNLTTNASILRAQGVGTILDDDGAPALSITDVSLAEGNSGTTSFTFIVSLLPASSQTVTVVAQTGDGTATVADNDYLATGPTTLTFPPGTTSQPFIVPVRGDTRPEADETFVVNLSGATGASILTSQATGTIQNDDSLPSLSINDVSVAEGNSGATSVTFTVTLGTVSGQTVTVQAQTADGTATAGSDYTATGPVTLSFAPGITTQTFTVPVLGDTVNEPDERFFVNLSGATNAIIGDGQGIGTIVNDDGQPTLSINDVSLPEGNSGTTGFRFTVSLGAASGQAVTVQAQTVDGTARAGSDYAAVGPLTLTFTPGTTTQTVTVPVTGDSEPEADETFLVRLSGAANAAIGDGEGLGTIKNDDGDVQGQSTPFQPQDPANNNSSGPGPKKEKDDGEGRPTEEQQQQHQLTNTSNKDDVSVEGNVVEVHVDEQPPYVLIANRDGLVKVILLHDAAKVAGSIRVGDYLEASGEKQNEQLFEASDISIKRGR